MKDGATKMHIPLDIKEGKGDLLCHFIRQEVNCMGHTNEAILENIVECLFEDGIIRSHTKRYYKFCEEVKLILQGWHGEVPKDDMNDLLVELQKKAQKIMPWISEQNRGIRYSICFSIEGGAVKNLAQIELSIRKRSVCVRKWVYKQEKKSERITRTE